MSNMAKGIIMERINSKDPDQTFMENIAKAILNWYFCEGEEESLRKLNEWLPDEDAHLFSHLAKALRERGLRK